MLKPASSYINYYIGRRGGKVTDRLYRIAFRLLCLAGAPIGGIRPRRIYHWLARKGWQHPEFKWYHDRRGQKLLLSPHIHLDRHIIAFGEYDKELHAALELCVKPGMTCLDIGANIGSVTLHMARLVGKRGRVHAFEPVPLIFERLIGNVKENGLSDVIQGYPIALSNYDSTAEIRYADALAENQGMGSLVRREDQVLTMSANVTTKTLDSFVAEHSVDNIDIIKMDVQGAEVFILEGGRKTLVDFSPDLFVEISPIDLSYAGKNSKDLISFLSLCGYHLYEFHKGKIVCRLQQDSTNLNHETKNVLCSKRILQKGRTL